jgi:hypothetical protein
MGKLLFTVLLLVSLFTPLVTSQFVPSQTASTGTVTSYTTSTATQSSTFIVTSTATQPLRLTAAPPTYNIQSNSFLLDQDKVRILRVRPFNRMTPFPDIDVYTCLHYEFFLYDAVAAQQVFLHFDAPQIVSFYIMNPGQLDYVDNFACNNGSWPAAVRSVASSADLNWTAPQSGQYAFVFAGRDVYPVHFTAYTLSTAIQNTTQTYATTTTFAIQNLETAVLAPSSSSVSSSPSSDSFVVIAVAVAALLILALVAAMFRRTGIFKPR